MLIEIVTVVVEEKNCIQAPLSLPSPFRKKIVLDVAVIYYILIVFGELYRPLIVNFMAYNFS